MQDQRQNTRPAIFKIVHGTRKAEEERRTFTFLTRVTSTLCESPLMAAVERRRRTLRAVRGNSHYTTDDMFYEHVHL
jgi:hypothetical protein